MSQDLLASLRRSSCVPRRALVAYCIFSWRLAQYNTQDFVQLVSWRSFNLKAASKLFKRRRIARLSNSRWQRMLVTFLPLWRCIMILIIVTVRSAEQSSHILRDTAVCACCWIFRNIGCWLSYTFFTMRRECFTIQLNFRNFRVQHDFRLTWKVQSVHVSTCVANSIRALKLNNINKHAHWER